MPRKSVGSAEHTLGGKTWIFLTWLFHWNEFYDRIDFVAIKTGISENLVNDRA